jgi:hypothetical protein
VERQVRMKKIAEEKAARRLALIKELAELDK